VEDLEHSEFANNTQLGLITGLVTGSNAKQRQFH
jgi:hypothetical protein